MSGKKWNLLKILCERFLAPAACSWRAKQIEKKSTLPCEFVTHYCCGTVPSNVEASSPPQRERPAGCLWRCVCVLLQLGQLQLEDELTCPDPAAFTRLSAKSCRQTAGLAHLSESKRARPFLLISNFLYFYFHSDARHRAQRGRSANQTQVQWCQLRCWNELRVVQTSPPGSHHAAICTLERCFAPPS